MWCFLFVTENAIIEKAKDLHSNLEIASNDILKLHAKMGNSLTSSNIPH